mgnify:FL=1|jgi:uncharacterized protein YjbI with pentapeptide repeats
MQMRLCWCGPDRSEIAGCDLELAALEDVDLHGADVRLRNLDIATFVNADRANELVVGTGPLKAQRHWISSDITS